MIKSFNILWYPGRANMGGDPQEAAEYLKEIGVEIYCIGITGDVRKKTLYKIASDPKEEHVFILENYSALPWLIQEIVNGTIGKHLLFYTSIINAKVISNSFTNIW